MDVDKLYAVRVNVLRRLLRYHYYLSPSIARLDSRRAKKKLQAHPAFYGPNSYQSKRERSKIRLEQIGLFWQEKDKKRERPGNRTAGYFFFKQKLPWKGTLRREKNMKHKLIMLRKQFFLSTHARLIIPMEAQNKLSETRVNREIIASLWGRLWCPVTGMFLPLPPLVRWHAIQGFFPTPWWVTLGDYRSATAKRIYGDAILRGVICPIFLFSVIKSISKGRRSRENPPR